MSLLASIAAGIGTLLIIVLAILLPGGASILVGDRTGNAFLSGLVFASGLILTFGTLLGVVYHYSP